VRVRIALAPRTVQKIFGSLKPFLTLLDPDGANLNSLWLHFKPKGPARILVRAIAADPTRTRSLKSPFQTLHTRIVLETRKRGPDGLASSAPTGVSGTWSWWKE
jgi:hypothetical protein